ncbi:MAG: LON peptidase substrate-binding domain-containing protein [Burkholderiaceae bacterium]
MKLPLFPLNAVLFPGGVLSLRVFEARYMDMARTCLRDQTPFGVCLIADGAAEVATAATPEAVGCLAHIRQCDMEQLGLLKIRAIGGQRFRVLDSQRQADGLLVAEVDLIEADTDAPLAPEHQACSRLLANILEEIGDKASADSLGAPIEAPYRLDSSVWVGNRLAEILPVPLQARQKLMELESASSRIDIIHTYLRQHAVLSA